MSSIYLDSNLFTAAVESENESGEPPRLLGDLGSRPGLAVSSELTLAEVPAPARRDEVMSFDRDARCLPPSLEGREPTAADVDRFLSFLDA